MEERNDQVDKGPAGDRKPEGYAELDRLLKQAIRCLEGTDLRGANEALKRAGAEAASLRDDTGSPELAGPNIPEAQNAFADADPVPGDGETRHRAVPARRRARACRCAILGTRGT